MDLCTELSRGFAVIMLPRLIWIILADPTIIAWTRRFYLCHRLVLLRLSLRAMTVSVIAGSFDVLAKRFNDSWAAVL